jgi:hypothetical protein
VGQKPPFGAAFGFAAQPGGKGSARAWLSRAHFLRFRAFFAFYTGGNRWSAVENTKRIQGFRTRNGLAQNLLIFL